jgi:hypothetical protein
MLRIAPCAVVWFHTKHNRDVVLERNFTLMPGQDWKANGIMIGLFSR